MRKSQIYRKDGILSVKQSKDFYAARGRIAHLVKRTPLEFSSFLSETCKFDVWLKLENQQHTGAYKVRSVLNRFLQLSEDERGRSIVTAFSGNHAQGVGLAFKMLGLKATMVVPFHTPT